MYLNLIDFLVFDIATEILILFPETEDFKFRKVVLLGNK